MIMRLKGFLYFSLVLLMVPAASCRKKENKTNFEVLSVEKHNYTYNSDFYHMSVEYPEEMWDYERDMQRYVESVVDFYKRDWSPGGMHYEKEMSFRNENDDREYPKFELYVRYQKYEAPQLKVNSYLFSTYVTTGGANGTTHVASLNFNKDGLMTYEEVFAMSSEQEIILSRLLAEQVKDSLNVFDFDTVKEGLGLNFISQEDSSLDSLSMKKRDFTFRSNFNAFIVADTGIHFHFDKYILAPGSSGTSSIFLSWEKLKPFLGSKFNFISQPG